MVSGSRYLNRPAIRLKRDTITKSRNTPRCGVSVSDADTEEAMKAIEQKWGVFVKGMDLKDEGH